MKNIVFALLLLPAVSFAENVNFFGAKYAWMSGIPDEISVDGYTVGYTSVIDEKLSAGVSYVVMDAETYGGYGVRADYAVAKIDFAFGSFNAGSLYAGAGMAFADGETAEAFTVGFAKRSGEEFDYDFAVAFDDGETAVGVSFRAPLGDSGLGWEFGVVGSDGITTTSTGLSISF